MENSPDKRVTDTMDTPYRRILQAHALDSEERGLFFFAALCGLILLASCAMLFFLAFARKELFGEMDPAFMVTPFLGFTLAMPSAVVSLICSGFYAHARSSRLITESFRAPAKDAQERYVKTSAALSWSRAWLYPAVAFEAITAILFLSGTVSLIYLILL